ncbi:MAG: hypothetical protein ACYTGZ_21795, partial [Planctomycetota bacterium]
MRGLLVLILLAGAVHAKVEHRRAGKNRVVKGKTYEAVLAPDGCITNLRVWDAEFLEARVRGSRGAYLHQRAPLRLTSIERKGADTYIAKNDVASIRYEFDDDTMLWTVKNRSKEPVVLFLVLADEIEAGRADGGKLARPVLGGKGAQTVWYRQGARLAITGADRLWGPFMGAHQVWEARVPPGAERKFSFSMDEVSEDETIAIRKLLDPFGGRDLLIRSPRAYQVVQRRTLAEGELFVSGRLRVDADA